MTPRGIDAAVVDSGGEGGEPPDLLTKLPTSNPIQNSMIILSCYR